MYLTGKRMQLDFTECSRECKTHKQLQYTMELLIHQTVARDEVAAPMLAPRITTDSSYTIAITACTSKRLVFIKVTRGTVAPTQLYD